MKSVETAYYAGGCFWGVEHLMKQLKGVLSVTSGYMGVITDNPTYEEVKSQRSGYAEVVKIVFDPSVIGYEEVTKYFMEIHDPTQEDGQGPDIGDQYRSEIFYTSKEQLEIAKKLIKVLIDKGYNIVTQLTPVSTFWTAEEYHQNYYERKGSEPYCHFYTKRF